MIGTKKTAGWLRIFCAALLLSLGFAHKPVYAGSLSDPASSYFELPDGSFPSICFDGGKDSHHPQKTAWNGCEACRIASSVALPMPATDHVVLVCDANTTDFPPPTVYPGLNARLPGSPVRGPPVVFA